VSTAHTGPPGSDGLRPSNLGSVPIRSILAKVNGLSTP